MSTEPVLPLSRLTRENYWMEIDALEKSGAIPRDLGMLLKSLVDDFFRKNIPPMATPYLIRLAKQYLRDGIGFTGRDGASYDVVVFVPGEQGGGRSFFYLVPKWSGGRLCYLDEL